MLSTAPNAMKVARATCFLRVHLLGSGAWLSVGRRMEAEARRKVSKANTKLVKSGVFCEADLASAAKGMGGGTSNECLTALAQGCEGREGHKKAPTL